MNTADLIRIELTEQDLTILFDALNDREGTLAADYERSFKASGVAKIEWLKGELKKVRDLAGKLQAAAR